MRQRWPSGLRALILIIISSQEVLRQFITKMTVHPRHPHEEKSTPAQSVC